jgi:DNA gyrase subunit B
MTLVAIKQTNQEIKTLSGLKHIRTRYGMYIGSNANAYHLYREARDNANDEIINDFATDAWFTIHEDGSLSVRDNGRGMPIQVMATADKARGVEVQGNYMMPMARAAISIPNTGSHYEDANSVSAGTNGVGAKAITALSDFVELKIWKDGKYYYDRLEYDDVTDEPGMPKVNLTSAGAYRANTQTLDNVPEGETLGYHGTEICFLPSEDAFEDSDFDYEFIVHDLTRIAYLNAKATYHVINEATGESTTINKSGGLKEYVQDLAGHLENGFSLITDIHEFEGTFVEADKTIKAKFAVAWSNAPENTEIGFTNT